MIEHKLYLLSAILPAALKVFEGRSLLLKREWCVLILDFSLKGTVKHSDLLLSLYFLLPQSILLYFWFQKLSLIQSVQLLVIIGREIEVLIKSRISFIRRLCLCKLCKGLIKGILMSCEIILSRFDIEVVVTVLYDVDMFVSLAYFLRLDWPWFLQ